MTQLALTLTLFVLAFAGMAIGVILTGKRGELKGSCGGVGVDPECCMTCPEKDACDEAEDIIAQNPELHAQFEAHRSAGGSAASSAHPLLQQNP